MENRYLKKYGQNFLVNKEIAKIIANSVNLDSKNVLEVGPGDGSITSILATKDFKLTVVEIDEFYATKIRNKFNNVVVRQENALKTDLSGFDFIIGNIPYNITSPLILKLATNSDSKEITLMIQKDAFERIVVCKEKDEITSLSVLLKTLFNYQKIVDVPRTDFVPQPHVDSTVFKLISKTDYNIENKREFYEFLLVLFNAKRKTILNNLIKKYNKEKLLLVFNELTISSQLRPEDLTIDQIVDIYKKLRG